MLGVGVLNWYPNRNPSDEIKRTTGFLSFDRGRIVVSIWVVSDEEEKKRKANAAEAATAMQVIRRSEMKRTVVVDFLGRAAMDEVESSSVSKERRAVDGFGGSSSLARNGFVTFVGSTMETESEPM